MQGDDQTDDDRGGPAGEVVIGRFRVREQIGAGANALIFAGWDDEYDRPVAIKLLRDDRNARPDVRARFLREAKAMARLDHPNIVRIYEVGTHAGRAPGEPERPPPSSDPWLPPAPRVFLAMEYVEGQSLREWVANERPSPEQIIARYVEAGRGLAAAHAAGLMHRDFKPDNVLLGRDGRVRVADFGLARSTKGTDSFHTVEELLPGLRAALAEGPDLLSTIGLAGTPAYMSLEQHFGRRVDPRSDQFSFAVALWEALFGQRPFVGRSPGAIARAIEVGKISAPTGERAAAVPKAFRKVLERALAAEPEQRWGSMELMLGEMDKALESKGLFERLRGPFRRE